MRFTVLPSAAGAGPTGPAPTCDLPSYGPTIATEMYGDVLGDQGLL